MSKQFDDWAAAETAKVRSAEDEINRLRAELAAARAEAGTFQSAFHGIRQELSERTLQLEKAEAALAECRADRDQLIDVLCSAMINEPGWPADARDLIDRLHAKDQLAEPERGTR